VFQAERLWALVLIGPLPHPSSRRAPRSSEGGWVRSSPSIYRRSHPLRELRSRESPSQPTAEKTATADASMTGLWVGRRDRGTERCSAVYCRWWEASLAWSPTWGSRPRCGSSGGWHSWRDPPSARRPGCATRGSTKKSGSLAGAPGIDAKTKGHCPHQTRGENRGKGRVVQKEGIWIMARTRLPKSLRKYVRRAKARIRREVFDEEEAERRISALAAEVRGSFARRMA